MTNILIVRLTFDYTKTGNKMKAKLEQELKDLQVALKNKSITVNEYQSFYYSISQKIKSL